MNHWGSAGGNEVDLWNASALRSGTSLKGHTWLINAITCERDGRRFPLRHDTPLDV